MPTRRSKLALLAVTALLLAAPWFASAATLSIVPACARDQGGQAPSLTCALQTFGNIAQLILGLSGALVLVMFVWGGFQWLTAFGDSKKVEAGKTIIKNAVIGLAIVLASGTLINYGMSFLVRNQNFKLVGSPCNGGKGVNVLTPAGEIKCVSTCAEIGAGYQCTTAQAGTCVSAPDCKSEKPYCCRPEPK